MSFSSCAFGPLRQLVVPHIAANFAGDDGGSATMPMFQNPASGLVAVVVVLPAAAAAAADVVG